MGAVLNTVYNNYLTTYTPKSQTRYDAHKKSELRSIYNSIVKLNRDSPWYLPTTGRDVQLYAVDIKENARELHNVIAELGGLEERGLLGRKRAYSTNEEVASATFIGDAATENEMPQFTLEVQTLASPQENMGLYLPPGSVTLSPDTYSFDIAINDMNYEFQFSIGEGDSNRAVQERLARLINNSDIGIKASVAESDSRTSLRMVSDASGLGFGKSDIFSITDTHTSKAAGAVDYFGLDYVSHKATNASFRINGEERSATSNHFTVSKLFEVQLRGISPGDRPVQVGLKTDTESITDNVTHLVQGYNDFIKAAAAYTETQSRSRHLITEMSGITSLYNESLTGMGMQLREDGQLEVNPDKLRQTAEESEDITSTFSYIKDLSARLLRKSNQISLNPMNYVDKTVVAYKNPQRNFVSPYTTSAYSGMMFNGYC